MSVAGQHGKGVAHDRDALRARSRKAWRLAVALAFAGLACAMLLGGLAAWFLGAVAIAGLSSATALVFNFHVPGALVRLFAIGRTVARYGERLAGHASALADQVVRRADLFSTMASAPAVRRAGWQLGDEAALSDYIEDVEDIDFGGLRVDLPAATVAAGLGAGLVAAVFVAPYGAAAIAVVLAVGAFSGRRLSGTAGAHIERMRDLGRGGAGQVGAAAASVVSLRAEGAWDGAFATALASLAETERLRMHLRHEQARLDALCGAVGTFAAFAVVVGAWLAGARDAALLVPVFVAFSWLALGEVLQGVPRMIIARQRRLVARHAIGQWEAGEKVAAPLAPVLPVSRLSHAGLARIAPDGRALGGAVALDLAAGRPTVLVGPSGAGKTSLLKQVAGWIGEDVFVDAAGRAVTASQRRALAMFCPHDAAVLADTVRANLFAPAADDDVLLAALAAVELDGRIAVAGGLDGWITQERLSLGEAQRLNLARALLSDRSVILLDEPAEHLDIVQGERIVERLCAALSDRIVVLSSHRAVPVGGAHVVALGIA